MTGAADYFLEPRAVARAFDRAARTFDAAAVLPRAAREQLLDRLDLVAIRPDVVLDAGTGTGLALEPLAARYPGARLIGVDASAGMLAHAAQRVPAAGSLVQADCHALPLRAGSVDLALSNLMLPCCHEPERVLAELRRVLTDGGLLSFTTLGPDTLAELREAWAAVDDRTHVNYFFDMHDVGDALQRAGFADPVMDVERYTLTYEHFDGLVADLSACGARNVTAGRPRGLTGRARFARVARAYERYRRDGRLPATAEVIYGHAWTAGLPPQRHLGDGTVAVPLENLGGAAGD